MMKIIGINASARKAGNSAQMLDACLKGAANEGAEVIRYDLTDLNYSGCRSCFACKLLEGPSFGKCALKDDLTKVIEDVFSADALVISTPIYFGDVPGVVRSLYERLWFPGLIYSKDGSIAYTKKLNVGLIYTMGVPNSEWYASVFENHKRQFEYFFGSAEYVISSDTLQFSDHSKYASEQISEPHKLKVHAEQFPKDLQNASEMGARLVK